MVEPIRRETTQFERGRIVGLLEGGLSQAEVSRRVGRSRHAVQAAWNRWLETNSNVNLPRSGRPPSTSARDDRVMINAVRGERFMPYRVIAANLPFRMSRQTLNRRVVLLGFRSRRPLLRIPLSPANRAARLLWCTERRNTDAAYWNTVVFSDESRFNLDFNDGRVRVHRRVSERYMEACIIEHDRYGGGGIMVWGAICANDRSRLVFVDGIMTATRYIEEVLVPEAIPFVLSRPGLIFMHDNARPHSAFNTQYQLEEAGVEMLPWPARSPDLNPIEHVWDIMGRRVSSAYPFPPATLHQLRQRLQEQWDAMTVEEVNHLILSMPDRVNECAAKNGGHTHY